MMDDLSHIILHDENQSLLQPDETDFINISDEDIFFAKERYKLHQSSPEEGVDIGILKNYFSKKYGL